MTTPMTFEYDIHFRGRGRGSRREMKTGKEPDRPIREPGRVPRVARLMALALGFDDYLRAGQVCDYAELADLGHVTRARISQIMNLLNLAPDLQETLLFLPRTFVAAILSSCETFNRSLRYWTGGSSGFNGNG